MAGGLRPETKTFATIEQGASVTRFITAVPALGLCLAFLQGARPVVPEYIVDGWSDRTHPSATFVFDRSFHEVRTSPDVVVAARNSAVRLRLHWAQGGGLYLAGPGMPVAPCEQPYSYAFTPSGSHYVCFQLRHPNAVLRVYRAKDHHLLAVRRVPSAALWEPHPVAFLDEDRLLFQSFDSHCSDQRSSIGMMSISGRSAPRTYFACANGIIVGSEHVAYLRGLKDDLEYSLDGRTWIRGNLYGLDADDRPITDGSLLVQRFMQLHPFGRIRSVSVGQAYPVGPGTS